MAGINFHTNSKTSKILKHMKTNGSITSWEAYELFSATRLSSIIFELRKHYKIDSVEETFVDRFGNRKQYSRYFYKGEIDE